MLLFLKQFSINRLAGPYRFFTSCVMTSATMNVCFYYYFFIFIDTDILEDSTVDFNRDNFSNVIKTKKVFSLKKHMYLSQKNCFFFDIATL